MTVSAIAILVVAGYYFRSRQSVPASQPDQSAGLPIAADQAGQLPATQTQSTTGTQGQQATQQSASKLTLVSQNPALDYFVDKGTNVFIAQPDGKIVKISGGSKAEAMSSGPISNIISASFSFDGKMVLAIISGNKLEVFNADNKTWRLYNYAVQSADWAPDSHRIAFLSPGETGALYLLDADSANASPVLLSRIRQEDMNLNWMYPTKIFLSDSPSANWNSSLWSFDVSKKTLSPMILAKPGLETAWSSSTPAVGIALISNANGQGGQLQLVDQSGIQTQALNFLTFPSKCSFYNKPVQAPAAATSVAATTTAKTIQAPKTKLMMVCGVPRDVQPLMNNPLPDAYQKKSFFTSDNFFEIEVATGNVNTVFNDETANADSSDLKIFNQSVFFINRLDQKIYSVSLPK